MQNIRVEIPRTTNVGNYVVYDLEILLEFNKSRTERFRVSKRFSDFVQFRQLLLNRDLTDLPNLPSKLSSFYKLSSALIEERRTGLANFSQTILNDKKLRMNHEVLNFFSIPKSIISEFNMITSSKDGIEGISTGGKYIIIDSAQHWMDSFKTVKSMLQNARGKMFASDNVIEIRKILKDCEFNQKILKDYLSNNRDLGAGEINRRNSLLESQISELNDLNYTLSNMKFNEQHVKVPLNSNILRDTGNTTSRRIFGKPKETSETKKYDNKGLLQYQQQKMAHQDQDLESLRDIIERQKQIGIAVNEELTIQNELLDGLGQQVDLSTEKMKNAKNKVNKII
ncbi:hypothetical protein CAS74_004599 [Pichia kudriavzevii]|uniref:Vacuolar morphogenesis protein 7 n=1 Tax=Pichia kudriavzevii TaxID=4909 RepID=A0A1Z8JIU3_PICKU|nr:hypothetical protein CAS74_004599 [Pichia kudriavzevii]